MGIFLFKKTVPILKICFSIPLLIAITMLCSIQGWSQSDTEKINKLFREEPPIRQPSKDKDVDAEDQDSHSNAEKGGSSNRDDPKSETSKKNEKDRARDNSSSTQKQSDKSSSTQKQSDKFQSTEISGKKLSKKELSEFGSDFTVLVLTSSGHGSGFFISPKLIMTNSHVISDYLKKLPFDPGRPTEGPIDEKIEIFTHDGQRKAAKVIARGGLITTGRDFAVLEISEPQNVAPAKFTSHINQLLEVYAFGFPGLVVNNLSNMQELMDPFSGNSTGVPDVIISAGVIHVVAADKDRLNSNMEMVYHSAKVEGGNSGGPLLDACGRVVGINSQITLEKKDVVNSEGEVQVVTDLQTGDQTKLQAQVSSGYERALSSNEIMKFLKQKGIQFETTDAQCE